MIEMILLAIIIAKYKKYKINYLFKEILFLPFLLLIMIFIIYHISIIINYSPFVLFTNNNYKNYQVLVLISPLLLLFKYLPPLRTIICFPLYLLGNILNTIAINSNNGFMPVFLYTSKLTGYYYIVEKYGISVHTFHQEGVKLFLLTDILDFGYVVYSIGDLLIFTYIPVLIYYSIKQLNQKQASQ
jgi:hypothetical protein